MSTAEIVDAEYGADQIEALEGLDPVRMRPGMYIGSTGPAGLHHLVWELVDNSVDEAMAGHADRIGITLNPDGSVTVTDNGRGVPIDPQKQGAYKGMPTVEMVYTVLHAGGKFNGSAYAFSGGLHGVGSSVVNALSYWMNVEVRREGVKYGIEFGAIDKPNGKIKSGATIKPLYKIGKVPQSDTGTSVTFLPDDRVFSTTEWDRDLIMRRIRQGAFLNPGLTFQFTDNRNPDDVHDVIYNYPDGLADYMEELTQERLSEHDKTAEDLLHEKPLVFGGSDPGSQGEWQMVVRWFTDKYYRVSSFANSVSTPHHGTHVKGYESQLTRLINRYAKQDHVGLLTDKDYNLDASDTRAGLQVIVSVKVKEPQFVGQTKGELSNPETQKMVSSGFADQFWTWMEEHPVDAKAIIGKMVAEMRLRMRLEAEEAKARAQAEKAGYKPKSQPLPHKLNDCRTKNRAEAELFIVEGDSAAGPAIKARNPETQAILPIRGKGLNIEAALSARNGAERIEANKEVQGMIATLGAGSQDFFEVDGMRYGKIIILADADADGKHIELLLMTMFYRLMPDLVRNGHLYVARPPLFTATHKGQKLYFADEDEREQYALANPSWDNEVIRFKGLGEMNTYQLKETVIDPVTRSLAQITVPDDSLASAAITSLMGNDSTAKWEAVREAVLDASAA